jgi:hypothetical protein
MLSYIVQFLFSVLPDTRFYRFKAFLLCLRGLQIGSNFK